MPTRQSLSRIGGALPSWAGKAAAPISFAARALHSGQGRKPMAFGGNGNSTAIWSGTDTTAGSSANGPTLLTKARLAQAAPAVMCSKDMAGSVVPASEFHRKVY